MKKFTQPRQSRKLAQVQRGFSLIEVLVALTIVSIGILGVVGLQTNTQKVSRNAYYHSQAVIIMHDIAERMRANAVATHNKFYDSKKTLRSSACHNNTGCSPKAMAQSDLYEWKESIEQQLPQGHGIVCIDSSPNDGRESSPNCDSNGSRYAIKLWWYDTTANKMNRSVMSLSSE